MHKNARFNIIQADGNGNPNFIVVEGQRTDSGHAAPGAMTIYGAMPREKAIELADKLEAGTGTRLIYVATGELVKRDDKITLRDGEIRTVGHFAPPHKANSEGKVTVHAGADDLHGREYYVSIIGAKWVGREDQQ